MHQLYLPGASVSALRLIPVSCKKPNICLGFDQQGFEQQKVCGSHMQAVRDVLAAADADRVQVRLSIWHWGDAA